MDLSGEKSAPPRTGAERKARLERRRDERRSLKNRIYKAMVAQDLDEMTQLKDDSESQSDDNGKIVLPSPTYQWPSPETSNELSYCPPPPGNRSRVYHADGQAYGSEDSLLLQFQNLEMEEARNRPNQLAHSIPSAKNQTHRHDPDAFLHSLLRENTYSYHLWWCMPEHARMARTYSAPVPQNIDEVFYSMISDKQARSIAGANRARASTALRPRGPRSHLEAIAEQRTEAESGSESSDDDSSTVVASSPRMESRSPVMRTTSSQDNV
ncbi:hypothetical protein EJ08DRAFT_693882 [Tothia fuscella]|uniref:Uncharacterized protein n=1 Tax=Tothia fuscella TaxID=1048955 RepID=A0A9P4U2T6_9PEZI|nr:hypothetical protein EJ08DRAFT_693882 [Tothia fuscella]